ncbi:CBS domain-containing protein [Lacticaseibacillus paracasei subsp. paracasei Lpp22]|uniref:CBS domain-containing protein n=1 Tax=Lacticaseibacillus paracasei subsp. paracasei Lpp22 TaxID=1256221 RepID=A0A8E0IBU5_LACPA|nr:CBS domain-containing protein [Lacticaseibacillus paracasei subsp. paracasei Lpp22]
MFQRLVDKDLLNSISGGNEDKRLKETLAPSGVKSRPIS